MYRMRLQPVFTEPCLQGTDNQLCRKKSLPFPLYPVFTVPDPQGHDIKLDSLKTSVAFNFMRISQNLIKIIHREGGKNDYDCKLPELDVVTMQIRYCVNEVLLISHSL